MARAEEVRSVRWLTDKLDRALLFLCAHCLFAVYHSVYQVKGGECAVVYNRVTGINLQTKDIGMHFRVKRRSLDRKPTPISLLL